LGSAIRAILLGHAAAAWRVQQEQSAAAAASLINIGGGGGGTDVINRCDDALWRYTAALSLDLSVRLFT